MSINAIKKVKINKLLYSNNDRSDVVPANTTLYSYVQIYI